MGVRGFWRERYINEERGEGMKHLSLAAVGLAVAMSVGAQPATTDEQQQQPAPKEKAKVEENVQPSHKTQSVQSTDREQTRTHVDENTNQSVKTRTNSEERLRGDERHTGARVDEHAGTVSHSTTVFRNGRETQEHLALHRGFRDRSDTHFSIGSHPRDWWLRTYSIVVMDGCHYYMADNGCWYPAYGFDPSCNFPEGAVYCE